MTLLGQKKIALEVLATLLELGETESTEDGISPTSRGSQCPLDLLHPLLGQVQPSGSTIMAFCCRQGVPASGIENLGLHAIQLLFSR